MWEPEITFVEGDLVEYIYQGRSRGVSFVKDLPIGDPTIAELDLLVKTKRATLLSEFWKTRVGIHMSRLA